jgi:pimeloyl-ACP methyl ester carboxylesterase
MEESRKDETMTLADGRRLGFAQYGPRTGAAVFHFHGSAGSRHERPSSESILEELGIRFFSIDRPGHGLSDPQVPRKLAEWPDDVRQLADHLGLDRFAVMGLSAGGPHALACAWRLRERIRACAVVSGPAPPDRPSPYRGLPLAHRMILCVFRNSPALTRQMRKGMHALAQADEATLREKLLAGFPPADRVLLERPENVRMMIEEIREGYRQGWAGPAADDTAIHTPWGFAVREVRARVDLWHGALDRNIPVEQARYLHERIPDSRLTVWPDKGHLGLLDHWKEVLAALAA